MPANVEDCVKGLMADPNFKPKDPSQSKEEAAWAVCQSQGKSLGRQIVKFWMPITKKPDGTYSAILSDTSLDRDTEMMGETLIDKIARQGIIPQLADHKNEMDSWTGGWKNLRKIKNGQHIALMADPVFFSENANPRAGQIKKQVDEAIEMGMNPGVSIGLIPYNDETKSVDGREVTVYTDGELVEASWTPVQSNRNATYGHIAKSFNIGGFGMKEKQADGQGGQSFDERVAALEQRISALEELATSKTEDGTEEKAEDFDANSSEGNASEPTQDDDISSQKKVKALLEASKTKQKQAELEKAVKKVLEEKLKDYKPQRKGYVPSEAIAKALGLDLEKADSGFNAAEHYLTKVKGMQMER